MSHAVPSHPPAAGERLCGVLGPGCAPAEPGGPVWPRTGGSRATPLLAHIYSAPLLAYGIGSVLLSRVRTWRETRIEVVGIGLFALLALVGSVIHRELFAVGDPAAWAWFALLAAMTAGALAMMLPPRSS